jgi:hypothetical protein
MITTDNYLITVTNEGCGKVRKYIFNGTNAQANALVRAMMFEDAKKSIGIGYSFDGMNAVLQYPEYNITYSAEKRDEIPECLPVAQAAPMYTQYTALCPGCSFGDGVSLRNTLKSIEDMAENE